MFLVRKISPSEFRLPHKVFTLDYGPGNYYEHLKLEIFLQRIIYIYAQQRGVYLFIQTFKPAYTAFLLQVYFYKTYKKVPKILNFPVYDLGTTAESFDSFNQNKQLKQEGGISLSFLKQIKFYSPQKISKIKYWSWKWIQSSRLYKKNLLKKFKVFEKWPVSVDKAMSISYSNKHNNSKPYKKPHYWYQAQPLTILSKHKRKLYIQKKRGLYLHFFFNFVFQYYFSKMVFVLSKSLYKLLVQNPFYKKSFQTALYKNKYLLKQNWTFDLVVAFHYTFIFSDTCFLFPFFVRRIVVRQHHTSLILEFVRVMYYFYTSKDFVDGVFLFLKGTYNKHSRTKNESFFYGKMSIVTPEAPLLYDAINCPTYYGSIQLKFWLYYKAIKY